MIRLLTSLLFLLLISPAIPAQNSADSLQKADSLKRDSLARAGENINFADSGLLKKLKTRNISSLTIADSPAMLIQRWGNIKPGPLINTVAEKKEGILKKTESKDYLFYLLIAIILVFAFLKQVFPKYFNDLFRIFFRTTLKARQVREQMVQTPLPSLLLNIFFTVTGGLYITFLAKYYGTDLVNNFWLLFLYSVAALILVYLLKYTGLQVSGWLFNLKDLSASYTFIVFIINKVAGIFLIPVLVMLAFTEGNAFKTALTVSFAGLAGLFFYRLILSYSVIRSQLRVAPFHFFLYLVAFEIIPLLLIYKGLMFLVGKNAY